jgi:hypothetical protein
MWHYEGITSSTCSRSASTVRSICCI